MKTGILILNFGGPSDIKDVKPFLYRLFSDPNILIGIRTPFRQSLAYLISRLKAPSSKKIYAAIGGGSPQLFWTENQANGLRQQITDQKNTKVEIGMRSSKPDIIDALLKLKKWGAEKLILFPLFPQYSTTTSGSCFLETTRLLKKINWEIEVVKVPGWADHPSYISLLKKTLFEVLDVTKTLSKDKNLHILFSAHSLPLKVIKKGDNYVEEVMKTINTATVGLKYNWSLSYQSKNGPIPWLTPYTENEIKRLGANGVDTLIIVPISFVSDHIETLYEIDMLYADLAKEVGIDFFLRTRSFNDDPAFYIVMHNILKGTGALC